ncbi:MAG: quinol:cytochrome C oxidoreductase [Phycisphaerales bacterium]
MAHHDHHAHDLTDANPGGSVAAGPARAMLGTGAALVAAGAWLGYRSGDPSHFARHWLVAMMLGLAICLGAMFFVVVQHLTRAGWSVAVRRPAEALMQNLRWAWVLFLPIGWMGFNGSLDVLYPWANLGELAKVAPAEAELVGKKAGYLSERFFFVRAAIYCVAWAAIASFFWGASVRQDRSGDPAISNSCRKWSGPAMIVFGLTITFAAVDWMMSLSPAWFSTMFGVYFFAACATCGLSAIVLLTKRLQGWGRLQGIVTAEHYQDLGKMLFAFGIVFWAYIAFSQFMLIWYGTRPEETPWYLARQVGGWLPLSWALLVGHFIVPFVFLISRWTKRWNATLAFGCGWMLVFGTVDLYYLIVPHVPHDLGTFSTYAEFAAKHADSAPHLLDPSFLCMALGVLALVAGGALNALRSHALVPARDPSLAESLAFENM